METRLAERCSAASIGWNVERPEGDYAHQLLAAAEEGDVVILERAAAPATERDDEPMIAELLRKAAAVVLPGLPSRCGAQSLPSPRKKDEEEVISLARSIAARCGLPLRCLSSQEFLSANLDCAILDPAGTHGGRDRQTAACSENSWAVHRHLSVVQSRG